MGLFEFLRNQPLHCRAVCYTLEPPRLVVKLLECKQRVVLAELCPLDCRPDYANGLVIDLERNRERVPVLAAMGERKTRRVAKAARRAVYDLGDESKRSHGSRADARRKQQIGKIGRAALRRGGEVAVQSPQMNVAGPDVVMSGQDEVRQCRL